ncbi:Protein phosphatase 2C [Actinacidiphila yanglinensis]|uniref:Protein phosphatase 2C n=1 Tax=Actinacidiphila yanglinensis TaxID=310779 RepID=A0A1H5VJ79_9ACTN|nr:protein phosphatase 2C domain-containing protein [Actinacidiphila yanglinensis]SEF87372.1 Protein phosphatase 2C [Actinacidiphila yanglinensis]
MRIETASEPGTAGVPNEDFAAVAVPASGNGGVVVVLDGVTPPPDNGGCVHSVPWFTARLGGALVELAVAQRESDLTRCLAEAISRTAQAHRDTCDLSHRLTPQATVVAARWDDAELEYLVLSDSVLLVENTSGVVSAVLDDRIDRLRATGARMAPLRNVEGGFFTAAADPAVAARAVAGRLPRADVTALAALTDGATRAVDHFAVDDWAGTFALLRKAGPERLFARVRALETEQPPAGKQHDDATAVLVEL